MDRIARVHGLDKRAMALLADNQVAAIVRPEPSTGALHQWHRQQPQPVAWCFQARVDNCQFNLRRRRRPVDQVD